MTQYLMLCLLYYLMIVAATAITCNTRVKRCRQGSVCSYRCPMGCTKLSPTESETLGLNYPICRHPGIAGNEEFRIDRSSDVEHALLILNSTKRKKRSLQLTPSWQTEPRSVNINNGKKIDLYCSVASVSDNVQYEWYYSEDFPGNLGDTLSVLYNGVDSTSGTLSISSATSDDAGYYQCKVTDTTQDGSHIIYSNIVQVTLENYYLKTPSEELSTVVKSSYFSEYIMILECPTVESNPEAVVTWYINGTIYSNQTGFIAAFDITFSYNSESYNLKKNSLALLGVTPSMNGVYKCRATNYQTEQYYELKQYDVSITTDSSLTDIKPRILREGSIEVELGTSVTLHCFAVGHPSQISYSWTKDSQNLVFDNNDVVLSDYGRKVVIATSVSTDAGNYGCTASNSAGTSANYIQLTLKTPTTVSDITITDVPATIYYHDVYLDNPESIFIPCAATGADQTRILKNGDILELADRYTYTSGVGVQFNTYDSSDSGVYQCVAFNTNHWKQKMTFVLISKQVSASATADVTLKDTNAVLSCAVEGYPYPDVTWERDGYTLSNMDTSMSPFITNNPPSHTLTIRDIGFTDGGVYRCTASSRTIDGPVDYEHSHSSDVTLTIEQRVTISSSQSSVTATVDDAFKLECGAYGKPLPTEVLWYVNNTAITSDDKYQISTTAANSSSLFSSLEISPLIIGDAGTYKCRASNVAAGEASDVSAEIVVLVKYLKVTIVDPIRAIATGDSVTITCMAQGSPLPSQLMWYFGSSSGKEIEDSDAGYTIDTSQNNAMYNSTLIVTSQTSDQDYMCEGVNQLQDTAKVDNDKAIVKIFSETQASRASTFVSTDLGMAATLTCYCSGVPLPGEAVWTKNGVTVTADGTRVISVTKEYDPEFKLSSELAFKSPTSGDIAEYLCTCTNTFEGDTHTAAVTVQFLVVTPVSIFWDAANPKSAEYGKEFNLTCTAKGLPRPTAVVWSRWLTSSDKLSAITDSGRFSTSLVEIDIMTVQSILTFHTTEYGDDGTYNCYVDNKIQDVIYSRNDNSTLLIFQNPTVTMGTNEYAASTDSAVDLYCVVSSKPPPNNVKWYFDDVEVSDQPTPVTDGYHKNTTYQVSKVTASTEGKYTCRGYHTYEGNEMSGDGNTYVRLYRPIVMFISTSPAGKTSVNENTEYSITCTASGVPEVTEFKWTIDSPLLSSSEVTSSVGTISTEVDYSTDININVKSTLVMDLVQYTNLGKYKCSTTQVWQGDTVSSSKSVDLTVNFETKLASATGSTEIIQDVGSQVRLTCAAYGNPKPDDITWKWSDGGAISGDDDYTINNLVINDYKKTSTLQLKLLPEYHKKDLECISKNAFSTGEEQKLQFTLKMNNNTMSISQTGSVAEGETVTLNCMTTFSIFSASQISWYKDDEIIMPTNEISFSTNENYDTKNSVMTIVDLDSSDDGTYTCRLIDGTIDVKKEYILSIGEQVSSAGMSTGIIIALIVLITFIVIVIILIIVVFIHGRRSKGRAIFSEKAVADGYQNDAYLEKDHHLQSVIANDGMDSLPKVVEPIVLVNNAAEHDIKVATIARQATLTQQRPRRYSKY